MVIFAFLEEVIRDVEEPLSALPRDRLREPDWIAQNERVAGLSVVANGPVIAPHKLPILAIFCDDWSRDTMGEFDRPNNRTKR